MNSLGIEATRRRLAELLTAAHEGRVTVVTKHGRPYAALVPLSLARTRSHAPDALLSLRGCAEGVWGENSSLAVAELRDAWDE